MKQVILVRNDLDMQKGKIGAQCAHASTGVILQFRDGNHLHINKIILKWLDEGSTKVILKVSSEEELLSIIAKAYNVPTYIVKDAGRTKFHGIPTITCAAIGPSEDHIIDTLTGHLKLF